MTIDPYEDLGERLDRLAVAFTDDLGLVQPPDFDLEAAATRPRGRRLVLAGVTAAAVVLLVVLALRDGPDARTEVPAAEPDTTTTSPPATTSTTIAQPLLLRDLLPDWAAVSPVLEVTGPISRFPRRCFRRVDASPDRPSLGHRVRWTGP